MILTGCGGVRNGTVPTVTSAQEGAHQRSGSSGDLLYTVQHGAVYIYTYPNGKFVKSFQPKWNGDYEGAVTMCNDPSGYVYIVSVAAEDAIVGRYDHGNSSSSQTLPPLVNYAPGGVCAVDPTTGNLALFVEEFGNDNSDVAVYSQEDDSWTFFPFQCCDSWLAYDNLGDLFADYSADGFSEIAELPAGGSAFANLSFAHHLNFTMMQWVSNGLAVSHAGVTYRLAISGSTVNLVGTTKAEGKRAPTWIQGNALMSQFRRNSATLALWEYPKGGKPATFIQETSSWPVDSILVSVKPKREKPGDASF
jgi:hypothetical protein